ncbi:MAG: hypothetical protein D3904_07570, partial [Candidatus Electrothrix sp. EH2]|nr:hypothetical protein [Candidatus Electrothrix sp. EH2]
AQDRPPTVGLFWFDFRTVAASYVGPIECNEIRQVRNALSAFVSLKQTYPAIVWYRSERTTEAKIQLTILLAV